MKHTAISILTLLSILLISLVSALQFDFNSPQEVNSNESFFVNLSAETSDNYDVKIFVHDDSKDFSEIYYNDEWKNPYYYIISAFPQTKEFQIRAYYIGSTNICARLRKVNATSYSEVCNSIIIIQSATQASQQQISNQSSQTNKTLSSAQQSSRQNRTIESFILSNESSNISTSINNIEKIYLNAPIENQESKEFITKQEKIKSYVPYAFIALLILIIIFLALRKL